MEQPGEHHGRQLKRREQNKPCQFPAAGLEALPPEHIRNRKQTKTHICGFGCCHNETGNFTQETAFEARPTWACRKRSLEAYQCPL
jgi:hypothetical protein